MWGGVGEWVGEVLILLLLCFVLFYSIILSDLFPYPRFITFVHPLYLLFCSLIYIFKREHLLKLINEQNSEQTNEPNGVALKGSIEN